MRLSPSKALFFLPPAIVVAIIAAACSASDIRTIKATVRAQANGETSASAESSSATRPAVFRGTLHAVSPNLAPHGQRYAAVWWTVSVKSGKSRKESCAGERAEGLELRTSQGTLKLGFLPGEQASVGIFNEGWGPNGSRPISVDLGELPLLSTSLIPGELARCNSGSDPVYTARGLPEGTQVEVLACRTGDTLGPCPGETRAVLATPTLRAHIDTRVGIVETRTAIAGFILMLQVLGWLVIGALMARDAQHVLVAQRAQGARRRG